MTFKVFKPYYRRKLYSYAIVAYRGRWVLALLVLCNDKKKMEFCCVKMTNGTIHIKKTRLTMDVMQIT